MRTIVYLAVVVVVVGCSKNEDGANNAQTKEPSVQLPTVATSQPPSMTLASIAANKASYLEIDVSHGGSDEKKPERVSNTAKIFASQLYSLNPQAGSYLLTALSLPIIDDNILRSLEKNSFEMAAFLDGNKAALDSTIKSITGGVKILNGCTVSLPSYDMKQEGYLIPNLKTSCSTRMVHNSVHFKYDIEETEMLRKPFHLNISKDKARELEKELSAGAGRLLDVAFYGKAVRAESTPEGKFPPVANIWLNVEAVELIKIDRPASAGYMPVKKTLLFIDGPELARSFR